MRLRPFPILLAMSMAMLGGGWLLGACSSTNNSNTTDACALGGDGCPCAETGAVQACGDVVDLHPDYATCAIGNRTCGADNRWSTCAHTGLSQQSRGPITLGGTTTLGLGTPSACVNDPCNPACLNIPDDGNGLDAGAGLQTTDAGGITLGISEGGTCTGLQCQVAKCDGGATTTLTGTVYDPAGLNPVYHAYVYVPVSLTLPAIPAGAQKDACGGGGNLPPAVSYFYTGPDGKFTLTGVPSGVNIPVVVQAGKWRRMVVLPTVTACSTTALPMAQTRLPQNKTDGYNNKADLPQIAIVSGGCDPMECLIKRIGVSTSEFTSPGAGGRVDYYQAYGEPLVGGTNPQPSALLGNSAQMLKEDLVMLPCDCGSEYPATSGQQPRWSGTYTTFLNNIVSYTSNGGRMFASHWARQWIEGGGYGNPFPGAANWIPWNSEYGYDSPWFEGVINTSFTKGQDFATWMQNVGASTTFGKLLINPSRYDTNSVTAPTQGWVSFTGRYTSNGTSYSTGVPAVPADFTFDTPLGQPPANQFGRVMYTDMHLASGFNTGSFPSECPSGGLSAQEKAAEFLLFDLGSCLTPLPPPAQAYYPATLTRDYQGVCPNSKVPVWRFFDWETVTPSDSNIVFKARTATTQGLLATAVPVVNLGTVSGAPITAWTGTDVGAALSPTKSAAWLRVTITLNPSSDQLNAPVLTAWRQQYDCVDAL